MALKVLCGLVLSFVTTSAVLADNPPGGDSKLRGISFALVRAGQASTAIIQLPAELTSTGAKGLLDACTQRHPIWLFGNAVPFQCVSAGDNRIQNGTLELMVHGMPAPANDMEAQLISTTRLHPQSLRESDEPQSDRITSLLPKHYKLARHVGIVSDLGSTYYFFAGPKAIDDAGCDLIKVAVLREKADGVSFLGTLDGMPRLLIHAPGQAQPLAWLETGCPIGPALSLVRLRKGLAVAADFVNGYEYGEPETNSPEVNPFTVNCSKATTRPETTICARPDLKNYDDDIADSYKNLRKGLRGDKLSSLGAEHKTWIRQRNRCSEPDTFSHYPDGEYGCLRHALVGYDEELLERPLTPR